MSLHRRRLLKTSAAGALAGGAATRAGSAPLAPVEPFPLEAVRLLPSDYLTAVEANRAYLMRLEPDRLLHNFRQQAGLGPKGEAYGGWESDSIAGHTLGHYLSALSLMHAQTGDAEACRRVRYIVSELALCEAQDGEGYFGALTYKANGAQRPGREMFEAVKAGRIHTTGFDLNGAWSPLYVVHKLMAGLLDADRYCGDPQALAVAQGLGGYIERVFAGLSDAQVQTVLACEYGGLNESYAELYARTGERRWLAMARTLYDRKVLDPLAEGRDELAHLHANTQIPKLIGLARLHQLTGDPRAARASRTFWTAVVDHHSYVIGGNADREYFQAPDTIASHITEQTCESCNSYNMLKLTRLLYAGDPRAALFDVYERAHINHILAQQNPATGMFAYMSPLMSGASRAWSTPFEDFWCCVGTGMESHAKHGDSIWWRRGADTLIVNLFIPSQLDWPAEGSSFRLTGDYPRSGEASVEVVQRTRRGALTLAVRRPGWAERVDLELNGEPLPVQADADGYLRIRRRWRTGDQLTLRAPPTLRIEAARGQPDTVALLHGPVVLAADLGPADEAPYPKAAPVLVSDDLAGAMVRESDAEPTYRIDAAARPEPLVLRSFAAQHERRTAVYFRRFTQAGWISAQAQFEAEAAAQRSLEARSSDVVRLGEMQAERDHGLEAAISYPVIYRGRQGRDARSGGFFQVRIRLRPGPAVLRATYWGEERNRAFRILADGAPIAHETLDGAHPGAFFDLDYPIPETLTLGKSSLLVRFEPDPDHTAGPVFALLCLQDAAPDVGPA
jgi:DUF1680 family protein